MPPSALTYADFYRTGVQDCGNVLSIDEFDLDAGTPTQIVEKAWTQWEADGMEEQWLSQQDDFEGLDPHKCYEEWRAGWKSCAVSTIDDALSDQREYEDHENPPPNWWRRPALSKDRPCYRTKSEALAKFLETNYELVENYGGADYAVSPSEFDSINHKYNLTGKRAARTIADAVWAAMPVGKPYCLDRIDLDALNDTSPAREGGAAFRLPDVAYESRLVAEEARHYAAEQDLAEPAWVTEHEPEPVQVFPPLPPLPYRLELEEQEPGVATYKIFSNPNIFSNPAASWRVWLKESPNSFINVEAGNAIQAMMQAAPKFAPGPLFRFAGSRDSAVMVALPQGETTWRTRRHPVEKLVTIEHDGRLAFQPKGDDMSAKSIPKENPAWVTSILSKHFVELEESVPSKWLPKLTKTSASRGKITAAMKEYGCGAYGCVLPTLDPKVVLKLTTDDTEAQFAHELADKLAAPVVVKYHLTRALPDKYKGRPSFLLWRDSADMVGDVAVAVSERGGDGVDAENAIGDQHQAAQDAYDALSDGKPAEKLLAKWESATRKMGQRVPELRDLAEGLITVLHKDRIFFGDLHAGNLGLVDGKWVVVDPGHVAVLEA